MQIRRICVSAVAGLTAAAGAAFFLRTGPFSTDSWTLYPPLSALGEAQTEAIPNHDQDTIVTIAIGVAVGTILCAKPR